MIFDGEILNYQNIAADCGVSAPTVKEYFTILEETLLGYALPAYTKTVKRRVIQASKFYLFDVGIVNYLTHRRNLLPGSVDYGHALEHLMVQEVMAYLSYTESDMQMAYWRTASGFEVDIILFDPYSHEIRFAIEIKSCEEAQNRHLKGLRALREEHPHAHAVCVSHDKSPRMTDDGIEIWPVEDFLKQLWNGRFCCP